MDGRHRGEMRKIDEIEVRDFEAAWRASPSTLQQKWRRRTDSRPRGGLAFEVNSDVLAGMLDAGNIALTLCMFEHVFTFLVSG